MVGNESCPRGELFPCLALIGSLTSGERSRPEVSHDQVLMTHIVVLSYGAEKCLSLLASFLLSSFL